MAKIFAKYKLSMMDKEFVRTLLSAIVLLITSLVVNFYAGLYATEIASNSVTDIILSNIRVYDVDGLFIYGTFLFWVFIVLLCLIDPRKLPFTLKSTALFILIRSIFISLTHIGPYPTRLIIDSNLINQFSFGGDLFFSGHTGLPFLMALIFWKTKYLRLTFLFSAILFAVVVLMAHLHYSIDVLSAFFITYTIYHIALVFFKKDRMYFDTKI